MGKRYYCDYCEKTMVAAPAIVRTHNNGIVHQKLVQEHYQQFKDPETILLEESSKRPCSRFANGTCQFGNICRYSHYNREQLDALRRYVESKNFNKSILTQPSFEELYNKLQNEKSLQTEQNDGNTVAVDKNGITHVFPWTYNPIFDSYGDNLPPSIKRLKIEDFENASITEWG
ncbi:hypothetical protein K1T71_013918 [Dendrolimus kikuchii]|uniref:Uncharacterized protein n=1 Tax=Dendrolimus kikuchii TaxID=765133 RepID=A0ACC1CGE2_9NEOP|nr:hypothetical protein K1T71_013918 [Dendrolimus kikuchii]